MWRTISAVISCLDYTIEFSPAGSHDSYLFGNMLVDSDVGRTVTRSGLAANVPFAITSSTFHEAILDFGPAAWCVLMG